MDNQLSAGDIFLQAFLSKPLVAIAYMEIAAKEGDNLNKIKRTFEGLNINIKSLSESI